MNKVMEIVSFISLNHEVILQGIGIILSGIISALAGLILLLMIKPGAQPQSGLQKILNFLQKIVDLIAKFSRPKKLE